MMEKYGVMYKYKCKQCKEEIVVPYYEEKNDELSKHAENEACSHEWEHQENESERVEE